MALRGVVSVPASPVEITTGVIAGDYALIRGGAGGREIYLERTVDRLLFIVNGTWVTWPPALMALEDLRGLPLALRLEATAPSMPTLVVSAYSNLSRHQPSAALIDAWVVTEQLLHARWLEFVAAAEAGRRKRLMDGRTYSAAVRLEMLYSTGRMSEDKEQPRP
jgi:hypothetical protein